MTFSIMTLRIRAYGSKLSVRTLIRATMRKMTLIIMALSRLILSRVTLCGM
jgi:hypothetical protein